MRHLSTISSVSLLTLTLVACGGDSGGASPNEAPNDGANGTTTSSTGATTGSTTGVGNTTGTGTTGGTTGGTTTGGGTGDTTAGANDGTTGATTNTGGDTTTGSTGSSDGSTTGGGTTGNNTGGTGSTNPGNGTTGNTSSFSDNGYVVPNNGVDASGGDDDSPTVTESLSLRGPFVKDVNRAAGPPSVPQGLTMLMTGSNWTEFGWQPSADDQSVEAYEIYRDNNLVFTLVGNNNSDLDYRSWITTTYMDCNYTRYASCNNNQPAAGSSHSYTVVAVDNEGMKSAHSAPLQINLVSPNASRLDLSGYNQVFNDEFEAGDLDRGKWKTSLPWGPDRIINGERQYFVNIFGNNPPAYNPFTFTGSTLQITGINTPSDMLSQANNQPYMSGVISTQDYFEMTYGYVEMNAKLASGSGLLSTFYLFNQNFDDNKPEIDIIEYIGDRSNKAYQTYHYFDSNRSRWASGENHSSPTMETVTGGNLSDSYHTYGVLWEKDLMVWYIDGVEVRRVVGPRVSNEPMNIIAHLVVGSEWIGEPNGGSLPAILEIDYIRAYQK